MSPRSSRRDQEVKGMLGDVSWHYWEQMGRDGGGAGTWGRKKVSLGGGILCGRGLDSPLGS